MGLSQRGRAWTALLLPPVAWFVFQQGLGAVLRVDCEAGWVGLPWGAAGLLLCGAAAWLARPLLRRQPRSTHPWLARLSLLGCVVFALAITFQTLAVAMVPSCAR